MINFDNLDYLLRRNEIQRTAHRVIVQHSIFQKLSPFSPLLTGTIPIAVDIPESDLDIICYWTDDVQFRNTLSVFADIEGFQCFDKTINGYRTIIARFFLDGFAFEVFGQNRPVKNQEAYRHMLVEYQVLLQKGETFRQAVIRLKQAGYKTEPAFAQLLGLEGNPYEAVLNFNPGD